MNDKQIDKIVAENCNSAIEDCKEYLEKEYSGEVSDDELMVIAQKIIYKRAVADTIHTLQYFHIL